MDNKTAPLRNPLFRTRTQQPLKKEPRLAADMSSPSSGRPRAIRFRFRPAPQRQSCVDHRPWPDGRFARQKRRESVFPVLPVIKQSDRYPKTSIRLPTEQGRLYHQSWRREESTSPCDLQCYRFFDHPSIAFCLPFQFTVPYRYRREVVKVH